MIFENGVKVPAVLQSVPPSVSVVGFLVTFIFVLNSGFRFWSATPKRARRFPFRSEGNGLHLKNENM